MQSGTLPQHAWPAPPSSHQPLPAEDPGVAEPGTAADPTAPHLVVLARGIASEDVEAGPLARTLAGQGHPVALATDAVDAGAELLGSLPADVLRRLGIGVDRRSLLLQPGWRSDEQAVERIGGRPLGPAHVTALQLSAPLRAAALAGVGTAAVRVAVDQFAANLARALALVGRGRRANLWLCALGTPVAVAHTLDVAALSRRIVGWPYAAMLRIRQTSAQARIDATGHRALDLLRARLPDSALAGATIRDLGSTLVLLAPPCTAFGRQRLFARSSHTDERARLALLPWSPRTADHLDLAGLGARITMAAATAAAERRRRHLPARPMTAAPTQLLPLRGPADKPTPDPAQTAGGHPRRRDESSLPGTPPSFTELLTTLPPDPWSLDYAEIAEFDRSGVSDAP